ncbi:MAG: tetratricopeptide repeat protein [Chitinophagales bacterium]|nr:tetratricopeptide repeat protein [Chitinophagales bacterium]
MNDLSEMYSDDSYDSSIIYSNRAIEFAKNLIQSQSVISREIVFTIKSQLAKAYSSLGEVERRRGSYKESAKHFMEGLKINEELNDEVGMAKAYCDMGNINRMMEHSNENSLYYFRKSLELRITLKDKKEIGRLYNNIGGVYIDIGRIDSALYYLKKSLHIKYEIQDVNGLAKSLNNLAVLYSDLNSDSSIAYYNKALSAVEKTNDKYSMSGILNGLGGEYINRGNFKLAIHYLDSSLAIARNIHSIYFQQMNYFTYTDLYEKKGDYKEALKYSRLYSLYRDSMLNEDDQKAIAEMQSKYESEKKDYQISKLRHEELLHQSQLSRQRIIQVVIIAGTLILILSGTIIFYLYKRRRDANSRKKEAEFNSMVTDVEMKALRAQMNPHFIFNSLRSINEYIQSHKTILASEYLIQFSKLMRAILENSRQKEIVLSKEVEVLELYMHLESQRMEHPFSYSIEIDPEIDPENTLIPPMLLQPIVENSIWHGLAPRNKPGKIIIRVKKQNETIQCEVEDNGIGREVSSIPNNGLKAESHGLKITAERLAIIEQIKKIETNLKFRDLNGDNNFTGLNVTFTLPFEEAV